MPEYYQNYDLNIPSINSAYLSRDGGNFLKKELQVPPGTSDVPGLSFRGTERLGLFVVDDYTLGVTNGWKIFEFSTDNFSFFNRRGFKLSFVPESISSDLTVAIPASNGTLGIHTLQTTYTTLVDTATVSMLTLGTLTVKCLIKIEEGNVCELFILAGALELSAPAPASSADVNVTASSAGALSSKINIYVDSGDLILDNRMGFDITWSILVT